MASTPLATHAVVHLLRFEAPMDPAHVETQPAPPGALGWVIGTDGVYNEAVRVLTPGASRIWAALGLFGSLEAASAAFEQPEVTLPLASRASEAWHALLLPIKHWGACDWLGTDRVGAAFAPSAPQAGDGPILVTTSAGYVFDANFDFARAQDFSSRVHSLRQGMHPTDGMAFAYSISHLDGMREGMTLSLWRNEAAVREFAYGHTPHRAELDRHREQPMFDRSAFTRYELQRTSGTWDGGDPMGAVG